jgi:hypothetical protein
MRETGKTNEALECWSNGALECWSGGVPQSDTSALQAAALLQESLFLAVASELGAAIDGEFLIDVVEMDLDGSLADEEFLADLHIAQSRVNFPGAYLRVS